MQRAAVVFGRAVLVSVVGELRVLGNVFIGPYLLGGSSLLPLRLNLLRATGSKLLTSSSGGGGTSSEDECSTSGAVADEALRRNSGSAARRAGLASLVQAAAAAARNGSSRKAMALCAVQTAGGWVARRLGRAFWQRRESECRMQNARRQRGRRRDQRGLGSPPLRQSASRPIGHPTCSAAGLPQHQANSRHSPASPERKPSNATDPFAFFSGPFTLRSPVAPPRAHTLASPSAARLASCHCAAQSPPPEPSPVDAFLRP